jgi:hypothetical protein
MQNISSHFISPLPMSSGSHVVIWRSYVSTEKRYFMILSRLTTISFALIIIQFSLIPYDSVLKERFGCKYESANSEHVTCSAFYGRCKWYMRKHIVWPGLHEMLRHAAYCDNRCTYEELPQKMNRPLHMHRHNTLSISLY